MDEPRRPSTPGTAESTPGAVPSPEPNHLESLVNTVGGVVWEFDWPTGAFTFVSDAAESLLGFPKSDWLESGFWLERLHPDDASWAFEFCRRATLEYRNHEFAYRMIHANGSAVWVRDIVSVDPDKGIEGRMRGLMIDVTAQKHAEERLATSEMRFREIIENVGVLAVQLDVTGIITFANDSAQRMFAEGELVGRSFFDLLDPVARERAMAAFNDRLLSGGSSDGFELPVTDRTGARRVVRWNSANLSGPHGELAGFVSLGEDVTERSVFEQQLSRKAEEFDAIFELSRDLFFRVNPAGYIVGYSAPGDSDLYAPPEVFMRRRYTDVLPPSVAATLRSGTDECHTSGGLVVKEYALALGGEDRMWEARFLPLGNGDTAVIVRDITSAVEAQRAVEGSRDFLADLLEMVDAGVILLDGTHRIMKRVNRPAERLFGYRHNELLGLSTRVFHPSDESFEDLNRGFTERLSAGELHVTEIPLVRKDGSVFDAEVAVRALSGPGGDRIGIIRDISSRKASERRLRESEQRFRAVVESAPVGMHFYRLEGESLVFSGANSAADEILGISNSALVGLPIEQAFPELADTDVPVVYRRVARDGGSWQTDEIAYEDDAISGAFEVNAFQIQPNQVVAMFRDVTRRRIAEQRERSYLRRLSAFAAELTDAEDSERRRLAEELHDRVSQSLAVTMMHLHAAEGPEGTCNTDELAAGRELLDTAIRETRSITTALFPPVLHEIGLVAALKWLCEETTRTHGLPCSTHSDDVIESRLSEQVRTVLFRGARELLMNAVKHAQATHATVTVRSSVEGVELTVADDGRGFDVGRVTADGASGFGLFSIRDRLPHLGGELQVESTPDQGTRVTLRMPWSN